MKVKQEIAHSKFENNQMSTHEKDHSSLCRNIRWNDMNIKQILSKIETLTGIKLPIEVIETSIVPGEGVLHVRFKEPKELELGEPLHPRIHLYRDKDTEEITALEVINPEELWKLVPKEVKKTGTEETKQEEKKE